MGIVTDILRSARERERRVGKARAAIAALTADEKGIVVVELIRELQAGTRRPKACTEPVGAAPRKTAREHIVNALSQHAPMNAAGIHAAIERSAPGAFTKSTIAAELSLMATKGLVLKVGVLGRGASFALNSGLSAGGAH
jgi:hypothetical protein